MMTVDIIEFYSSLKGLVTFVPRVELYYTPTKNPLTDGLGHRFYELKATVYIIQSGTAKCQRLLPLV